MVLLLVATATGVVDLVVGEVLVPHHSVTVGLSALACASLMTTGVLAYRAFDEPMSAPVKIVCTAAVLLGVGAIEPAIRASSGVPLDSEERTLTLALAVVGWVGRGLLTFGLASFDRGRDRVIGVTVMAATSTGIVGVFLRGTGAMPSTVETVAGAILASTLLLIAIRWVTTDGQRPALYGSIAFLSCGAGLALVFGIAAERTADAREVSSLAWLVVASALAGAWLDRRATALRRERETAAFDAVRMAEEQRVLLETAELEHSVVRHDSRSSLTAVEGGVHALVSLHESGDTRTLQNMSAVILAELSRIRRMLDGTQTETVSSLAAVLSPLVALHRAGGLDVELAIQDADVPLDIAPDHLAEAMENLLSNCKLHAPGAKVRIVAHTTVGGERMLITVEDDGPGIDPEIRSSAFDPHISAAGYTEGLGLHAVHSLITAANGRASLQPSFGGTRVCLDLPTARPAQSHGDGPVIDLRDPHEQRR